MVKFWILNYTSVLVERGIRVISASGSVLQQVCQVLPPAAVVSVSKGLNVYQLLCHVVFWPLYIKAFVYKAP